MYKSHSWVLKSHSDVYSENWVCKNKFTNSHAKLFPLIMFGSDNSWKNCTSSLYTMKTSKHNMKKCIIADLFFCFLGGGELITPITPPPITTVINWVSIFTHIFAKTLNFQNTHSRVISTHRLWFLHAKCNFDTHECDWYEQAWLRHARVWFLHIKCNFHMQSTVSQAECNFYTLSVNSTRINVITSLTSVVLTRTSVN
jgi:hypothetical protein